MIQENFFDALRIMGLGMAGIFVFMLLFWGIIVALHRVFPAKSDPQKDQETA